MSYIDDLRRANFAVSQYLGVNPLDIGTAMSYETGGTFDPNKVGPTTKWGTHRGLFQMGDVQRAEYGIPDDANVFQQAEAAAKYLKKAGVRPGMGLLDIYSAINTGRVGRYDSRDAAAGGAAGSVMDKVMQQMEGHKAKSAKLFGNGNVRRITSGGLTTIRSPSGVPFTVAAEAAPSYSRFLQLLESTGYKLDPKQSGGYNYRNIAGTNKLSKHATGHAIDINWSRNPRLGRGKLQMDLPGNIRDLAAQAGLVWGGDWGNPDPMHFEYRGGGGDTNILRGDPSSDDLSSDYGPGVSTWENPLGGLLDMLRDPNAVAAEMRERSQHTPIRSMSDEELQYIISSRNPDEINYANAQEEISRRARWDKQSWFQNLVDPEYIARQTSQSARQAVAGVAEVPAFATDITAGLTGLIDEIGGTDTNIPEELAGISEDMRLAGERAAGIDNPENALQSAAKGAVFGPIGIGIGGVGHFLPDLLEEPDKEISPGLEFNFGSGMPGDIRLTDPGATVLGDIELDDGSPISQMFIPSAEAAEQEGKSPIVPVDTGGGPTEITADELRTLGGMGIAAIGMAIAPHIFRVLKAGIGPRAPKPKLVENNPLEVIAPKGAESLERTSDLLDTQIFDATSGAKRILRRSGVPASVLDEMTDAIDISTHAAGRALIHNALSSGRMSTVAGDFNVHVPLSQLKQTVMRMPKGIPVGEYLHLWNTYDDLIRTNTASLRGVTRLTSMAKIRQWEAAYPVLKDLKTAYKANVDEMYRFLSDGQFAVVKPADARTMLQSSPNYVPGEVDVLAGRGFNQRATLLQIDPGRKLKLQKKPVRHPRVDAVPLRDPIDSLVHYQYVALQTRIENEIAGRYIDALRASTYGKNSAIRVTPKQIKAHPEWKENLVTIHRNGSPETYWMTQLLADTFKFDPYYLLTGLNAAFSRTKRGLEMTTTGYLAPWFAPVQALRDIRIGKVTTPLGMKKPTYRGAIVAFPKQVAAKSARNLSQGIQQSLDAGSSGWFTKTLGRQGSQALANRLAYHYNRSLVASIERLGS